MENDVNRVFSDNMTKQMKPVREAEMHESRTTAPPLRISVAMCTYNGSAFLAEQLDSIAAQSRLPCELVVCDDCSSDATPEIVAKFARNVPFAVRFLRNPTNLGSTGNFEQAISLCTGDLIALCDQDDIWMPEKLARQAELLERDPELGGVFSDALLISEGSQPLGKQLWESIFFTLREQEMFKAGRAAAVLINKNVVTGATLMFRASMRPLFSPVPTCWVHDGWISWMLVMYSRLSFIEKKLISYRIHVGQQAGIGPSASSQPRNLLEWLEKVKNEEPARVSAHVRELEELKQRLVLGNGFQNRAVLSALQQKIYFLVGRSSPYSNRLERIGWILWNSGNYHRYENGLKGLLRDLVVACI